MDDLDKLLAPYSPSSEQGKKGKVMVIDDDPGIRDALEDTLQRRGYDVSSYATGVEALSALDRSVSVVVLDAKLPKLDGCVVYERIKRRHDIPVIFHTAYVGEDSVPYRDLEPFDYIIKGHESQSLYDAIDRAVKDDG